MAELPIYGPAPTKGGQSTEKDSQTEGTLAAIVLQPVEQAPSIDADNNLTYVEIWKGPYGWAKGIYNYNPIDKSRDDLITSVRGEVQVIERFNPPSPGEGNAWYVQNLTVRELEAGDHAEIRINYNAREAEYDPGQTWNENVNKDTWNLTWQSYSVSPYAFCKNDPVEDPPFGNYDPDDWDSTAWRKNIEDFFQSQTGDKSKYEYSATMQRPYNLCLNNVEREIAKKIMNNTGCVYHYPMLTHHREWNKKFSSLSVALSADFPHNLGEDIDHIVENHLSVCPYRFPIDKDGKQIWKWVKVGDTMVQTKDKRTNTVTFSRDEQWMGSKDPDKNFYGNNKQSFVHDKTIPDERWEIGKL